MKPIPGIDGIAGASDRTVAVVTPWYPTRDLPFRGAFVRAMVEATAPVCEAMTVYHCDRWSARLGRREAVAVSRAFPAVMGRAQRSATTVGGARLAYVPAPIFGDQPFANVARAYSGALTTALGGAKIPDPVIHAHVGFYTGYAAMVNARPDAKIFVTEHATFLAQVLDEPAARAIYDEVLHRCTTLFAVGEHVRQPLVTAFPHHADRIELIANPISFDVVRDQPVTHLRRWLYIGSLIERKGVGWLLEAFAECWREDPSLTLTLVGEGALRGPLESRAIELGVAEAVTFTGAVSPPEALEHMSSHDLLVHNSRMETFGVTIVEAVAAGMPVIVTRCGGPEETLAGIEDASGELIPVEESEKPIVAAYRRLRDRFPSGVDISRAQAVLEQRYGYPAVARAHESAWFGPALP